MVLCASVSRTGLARLDAFKATAFKLHSTQEGDERGTALRGWLKRRREAARQVAHDADALMRAFGEGAYGEARRRAIDALQRRPVDPHWSKVRREIGKRTGRIFVDTATRYLDN